MSHFEFWRKYGVFLAVNLVLISIVLQLIIRGSWALSGFLVLALVVCDLFVGRILRKQTDLSARVAGDANKARSGFFRLYGYALVVGGLIWLSFRLKAGFTWMDFAPLAIFGLLALAMLSISSKRA